jgi:hypothetical protein
VDKNRARAEDRLTIKRADANVPTEAYTHTKVFESIEHASQSLDPSEVPQCVVTPAQSHTSLQKAAMLGECHATED